MESLRMIVRDAIQEYLEKANNITVNDPVDVTCDIADVVFDALGIFEKQQDIEGAKVAVILKKNKVL